MTVFHNDAPEMGVWLKRRFEKTYYNGNINSEKNKGGYSVFEGDREGFGDRRRPRTSGAEEVGAFRKFLDAYAASDREAAAKRQLLSPHSSLHRLRYARFC